MNASPQLASAPGPAPGLETLPVLGERCADAPPRDSFSSMLNRVLGHPAAKASRPHASSARQRGTPKTTTDESAADTAQSLSQAQATPKESKLRRQPSSADRDDQSQGVSSQDGTNQASGVDLSNGTAVAPALSAPQSLPKPVSGSQLASSASPTALLAGPFEAAAVSAEAIPRPAENAIPSNGPPDPFAPPKDASPTENLAVPAAQFSPAEAPNVHATADKATPIADSATPSLLLTQGWTRVPPPAEVSQNPQPAEAESPPATIEDGPSKPPAAGTDMLHAMPDLHSGTPVAQRAEQMKEWLKPNKIAALAANLSPKEDSEPASLKVKALDGARVKSADASEPALLPLIANQLRGTDTPDNPALIEVPKAEPAARLFHHIIDEVAIVRRLQPDSLAVVVKPDSKTEIFVRLELKDGRLEASARCDRGDFQLLNTHWSDLRRCLQQQGVRLQDLQQRPQQISYDSGASLANSFHQNRQKFEPREVAENIPLPFTSPKSVSGRTSTTKSSVNTKRLLESWA
jgi:hypothetical protein